MIEIRRLTKSFPIKTGRHYVFKNVSAVFPEDANIAIIGPNGGGKTTFMRILGGIDYPDSGEIVTRSSFSWPLGLRGGFVNHLSGRENCRMICSLYGVHPREMGAQLGKIKELSGIGEYFEEPFQTYSSGMGGRIGFALSMSFDFDYFLIDEITAVGDAAFKELAKAALEEKARRSKIILVSHSMGDIRKFCDVGVVLKDGNLTVYEDVETAIRAYLPQTAATIAEDENALKGSVSLTQVNVSAEKLPAELKTDLANLRDLAAEIVHKVKDPGHWIEGSASALLASAGDALLRLGDLDSAEFLFKEAVEEDSWSFPGWKGLSQVAERRSNFQLLETCLAEMVKVDPHHPAIQPARARMHLARNEAKEAAELAESILQKTPRNFGAWQLYSRASLLLKDYPKAKEAQVKAIQFATKHDAKAPYLRFYYRQLAEILQLLQDPENATAAWLASMQIPEVDIAEKHQRILGELKKLSLSLHG